MHLCSCPDPGTRSNVYGNKPWVPHMQETRANWLPSGRAVDLQCAVAPPAADEHASRAQTSRRSTGCGVESWLLPLLSSGSAPPTGTCGACEGIKLWTSRPAWELLKDCNICSCHCCICSISCLKIHPPTMRPAFSYIYNPKAMDPDAAQAQKLATPRSPLQAPGAAPARAQAPLLSPQA